MRVLKPLVRAKGPTRMSSEQVAFHRRSGTVVSLKTFLFHKNTYIMVYLLLFLAGNTS